MIYKSADDPKTVTKALADAQQITATVKEPIDVMNPEFLMHYDAKYMDHNYLQAFGRFYYFTQRPEPGNTVRLICTEDVLMSYDAAIRACPALASRSTNKMTLFIPDSQIRLNQYTYDETISGGQIFAYNGSFILITTG